MLYFGMPNAFYLFLGVLRTFNKTGYWVFRGLLADNAAGQNTVKIILIAVASAIEKQRTIVAAFIVKVTGPAAHARPFFGG